MPWVTTILLLQGVPPRALVLAMTLAYALCFAGMLFAYLSYRRRQKQPRPPAERPVPKPQGEGTP